MPKLEDLITNKEAQNILKRGDRKQMILEAEDELKKEKQKENDEQGN